MKIDLQHGQIGVRVGADDACLGGAPVGQGHLDFVGILDHVMVGQDVALLADDDAGAEAALLL